jgi:hypothetical protein
MRFLLDALNEAAPTMSPRASAASCAPMTSSGAARGCGRAGSSVSSEDPSRLMEESSQELGVAGEEEDGEGSPLLASAGRSIASTSPSPPSRLRSAATSFQLNTLSSPEQAVKATL